MKKQTYTAFLALMTALVLLLSACGQASDAEAVLPSPAGNSSEPPAQELVTTTLEKIPQDCWQYNETDDVYWQGGIAYCENPADEQYETLGIFVPGAYLSAQANGDGTYTCTVNEAGTVGRYTARTAPS